MQGGTWGGTDGALWSPSGATVHEGAQWGGAAPETTGMRPRGVGAGGHVGAQFGGTWGGTWGLPGPTVDELLDVDGFALVLDRADGERRAFSPADAPVEDMLGLALTFEMNNLADWEATVPADPELAEWVFSDVIIGFQGRRLFHGELHPIDGSHSSGTQRLSGYGPLREVATGEYKATFQDMPVWQAINDVWDKIADRTEGRVRGYAIKPPAEHEVWLPPDQRPFSGTPLSVLKKLHAMADMAFAIDHAKPTGMGISFTAGTEARAGAWQATDYSPNVDPGDYHNEVVVQGADAPDYHPTDRYQGVATAPPKEIREITNGVPRRAYFDAPDLMSDDACEQRATAELANYRTEFQVTGTVSCTPTHIVPGFNYRVPEFDRATPDVFTPVVLPLYTVEHSFGLTEAQTTLKFETEEGVVAAIRRQVSDGGDSKPVSAFDDAYGTVGGSDSPDDGETDGGADTTNWTYGASAWGADAW